MDATLPQPSTSGFSEKFAEIYEEHSKPIYYLALRFLGNATLAEDAVQDVFVKAFRKLPEFRGDSNLRTWLYRIAINHCQNLVQSWHHRKMMTNVPDLIFDSAPQESTPLRLMERKELGEQIQETLARLPEGYRLLLLLVADETLSYREIAGLTGQTEDAVRGKLHRARKAFQIEFQKLS